ncbi:MAG: hypothetical protein GXO57_05525 [Thermodesulfobacteria bacterium]|nr:hypothetical protein [Thermodesulfobacteriota bacterium]
MIESYSFGRLVFNGKTYTRDLIILFDGENFKIYPDWWRKEGHFLQEVDLEEVWKFKPEYLVVGTGAYGVMKVSQDVYKKADSLGIKIKALNTSEATSEFNKLIKEGKKIAGAFHLTC